MHHLKNFTVHVRFRFFLSADNDRRFKRLFSVYSRKFSELISKTMTTPLTTVDYDDLPAIRAQLSDKGSLDTVLADVGRLLPAESIRLLIDVTPIYNICPKDLRAFILL